MVVLHNLEVQVWINFSLRESQSLKITINSRIPSPEGLLKPIQGFIQFNNNMRSCKCIKYFHSLLVERRNACMRSSKAMPN